MTVALFTHAACLAHEPGPGHPESRDRLVAVQTALAESEFANLARLEAPPATTAALTSVHSRSYVEAIFAAVIEPGRTITLDPDTHMSAGSLEAALRAAGGAIAAVDHVLGQRARTAFVATRPPGHHAEMDKAMGFCLFNSVAIAAHHARAAHGLRRIAVVDFDAHHGNGTQAMFWNDPDLFYGSVHQMPCYPGTGAASERGAYGNIVNYPLPPGAGSGEYRAALTAVLDALQAFSPDLVLASAGFDAHVNDPLAAIELETEDFAWTAARLLEAGHGRLVSVLEGGYHLDALAESVAAYLRVMLAEETAHD